QSLSNELDKDERYTRTRMKSLRERISLSKSDVEKKMRENVSSIISQINAVSTRIPELQGELDMHDKELKDLIDCETLDVRKITGKLSMLNSDVGRFGKKLSSEHKVLVLDLRNRLSQMEISLNESLKSQSDLVRKEIDTVSMHIPRLKSKLSVHERQFSKMVDNQKLSAQNFSESIEKLSSTLDKEQNISSSKMQMLKRRIENVNRDLKDMHRTDFNVIDNAIKDNVSALRSDITQLGRNIPVIRGRLQKYDSNLKKIMRQESFDVRALSGRLDNFTSEIDDIENKQIEDEKVSVSAVSGLRKNILELIGHIQAETSKKFLLADKSFKNSLAVVRKEIDDTALRIPALSVELSKYSLELKTLSENQRAGSKELLDKLSELSSDLVLLSSRVNEDEKDSSDKITHLKSRVLEIRGELDRKEKIDLGMLDSDMKGRISAIKSDIDKLSDDVPELKGKVSSISLTLDSAVKSEVSDVGELSGRLENIHDELKEDEVRSYAEVKSLGKRIDSVRESLRTDLKKQAGDLSQKIDSVADMLPDIQSSLKAHAKGIRVLTEKETFDVRMLSVRLDGMASELAGFEKLSHDSIASLRSDINDVNENLFSNFIRSISLVRSEIADVGKNIPILSKKLAYVDKSLAGLSRKQGIDAATTFSGLKTLSGTVDFLSGQFMDAASENSRKVGELRDHVNSLNSALDSKMDKDYDKLLGIVSSKADALSRDIDSL
ncbi:MAG: hypothetical protein U9O53_04375, partial [archaeon]|nr:hypothetical protein [archaeon]